jgi:predicted deacylase
MPTGDQVDIVRRRFRGGDGPRVVLVAGIRGDAPEGIRVAHNVARVLAGCHERLNGIVDIYPCINPLAAHRGLRNWPFFDLDLNRRFPGRANAHAPDLVARTVVDDVQGADQVLEVRGAHSAFAEAPQAQVRAGDAEAAKLACSANVHVVWARTPGPAAPSTFAWQFPNTIVLEGGTGNRLTPEVATVLSDGILNLLNVVGVLPDEDLTFHWAGMNRPTVVVDDQVHRIRADVSGLFLPRHRIWDAVEKDELLGEVIDPISGIQVQLIRSPQAGRILALREQPVVLPGSMVARIVEVPDG